MLKRYVENLGLPTQLETAGIKRSDLPVIAAEWDGGAPIATNPRKVNGKEDLLEILGLAW